MGPKKAKKSKAELEEERLAREEEERKAKAAEEKRLAEEREKKRQEEARIAAELKVIREADLQRWKEEYEDFVDELKLKHQQLIAEEKSEQERLEWLRYKDPSDEIDATLERDMNTFITQTRETVSNDMKENIEVIKHIEKLVSTVEDVWSNSLANKDYPMQERAYNNLHILRDIILEKLDQATIPLIRFAEKHLNDRVELNCEEVAKEVSIGLWATFNDIKPIRKSVQLEAMGVQLDIPKQVLQQHERYVYRVIRLPIVTYNLDSYMHSKGHHMVTLGHNQHHHQHRHDHHHQHHHLNHSPGLHAAHAAFGANRHHHSDNLRRKSKQDSLPLLDTQAVAAATAAATADATPAIATVDGAHPTNPAEGSEAHATTGEGAATDVEENPKSAPAPKLTPEQQAALNSKYVVGDLIYFDILYAPAQPFNLRAKKWLIRDNSSNSTTIRKASYPSSVACRMFIKVPDHISLTDDLRIAVWNEDHQDWVEDGITDYQYSEATRIVQFYVTTTGIFALVKKRLADMPLKKWSLYPVLDKPINRFMHYRYNDAVHGGNMIQNINASTGAAATTGGDGAEEQKKDAEGNAVTVTEGATEGNAAAATDATATGEGIGNAESEEHKDPYTEGNSATRDGPSSNIVNTAALMNALNLANNKTLSLSSTPSTSVTHFEQHARLSLQTNQYEVIIDVIGSDCYLVRPDAPFCRDILNRPLSPGVLLMKLQKKGIHLIPTDYDLTFGKGCCTKRRILEDEVWRHVASSASALEFTSAKDWNTTLNESQIGVLTRESCIFACPGESYDFECVLVERDEVSNSYQNTPDLGFAPGPDQGILYTLVLGNEYGNKKLFSHVPRPNEKAHVEFHKTLESRLTPEAMVRMRRINQRFQKTVYTLLSLIKIYSQS